MRIPSIITLAVAALAVAAAGARAQGNWPSQPITLVVPFAAGSGTDLSARLLAKDLAASLGASVVVDNKPGANGAIGAQFVARAAPDGYTLMVSPATASAVNYAFFPGRLGYEPGSFAVAGTLGAVPAALLVAAESPHRTVADLLAAAKAQPGRLNCGAGNAVMQVACEALRLKAGIDTVTVPYRSVPQSITDLLSGQVQFTFADGSAALSFLEGGRARMLAVGAEQRNPAWPQVPTLEEAGLSDIIITSWSALFAPAGTPEAILDRLHAAVLASIDAPETVRFRTRAGAVPLRLSRPEAAAFVSAEIERWRRYVAATGVKPEP